MKQKLRDIYAVFSPSPLQAEQQGLYVDMEDVRGHADIVRRMAGKIRLSDGPTCQVLAGHRGSGKSTELGRLRQSLQQADDDDRPYFTILVRADDELDRNDIDFPDVLIALVRQLAQQLRDEAGIELRPGFFKDRLAQFKTILGSEIAIDEVTLDAGMAQLTATLKNSPDARAEIRRALEPNLNRWLNAANDVIGDAIVQLKGKGYQGLVIMVDDLDKMITRPHDDAGCTTTEYLFIHRSAQLRSFKCHLIYTLPIDLAYSHHEANIKMLYGGQLPVLPMTKIMTPPPGSEIYEPGMEKFREIIRARLSSVKAHDSDLFESDEIRDQLIELTGGQPTELMSQIREALVTDGLPIGAAGVKRCRVELERGYKRLLRLDHWPLIEEARQTGRVVRTQENEAALRELLDSRTLLLYINDREWYAPNPAIAQIAPPESQTPA